MNNKFKKTKVKSFIKEHGELLALGLSFAFCTAAAFCAVKAVKNIDIEAVDNKNHKIILPSTYILSPQHAIPGSFR